MSIGSWLSENIYGSHADTGQADKDIDKFRDLNTPFLQREGDVFKQDQGVVSNLQDTIAGRTPSVAQAQLGQAMGDIQANQQAAAAGARGQGAVLARYGAAQGTANAQARMGGNAAIVRAKEIEAAQGNMIRVLAQMGMQSTQMYQQTLEAYLDAQHRRQALEQANAQASAQAFGATLKGFTDAAGVFGGNGAGQTSGGGGGGGGGGMLGGFTDSNSGSDGSGDSLLPLAAALA